MLRSLLLLFFYLAAAVFVDLATSQDPGQGPSGDSSNHFIYPGNSSADTLSLDFILGEVVVLKWITNYNAYTVTLNQDGEFVREGPVIYNGTTSGSGTLMKLSQSFLRLHQTSTSTSPLLFSKKG